jgi:hypothetical protein
MRVHVKDGTPVDGPSLCESCVRAHIERGYRQNEEVLFCMRTDGSHRVTFRVRACTSYMDMKCQPLWKMEEIAWVLTPRDGKRVVGFRPDQIPGNEPIEIEGVRVSPLA